MTADIYSFELAKEHEVITYDLVDINVEKIKPYQKQDSIIKEIYQLNAMDMKCFEDNTFDIVLCMGTSYPFQGLDQRK